MVQRDVTLVGQTTPGELNGHVHSVQVDENGNGVAQAADGHTHQISNFQVSFDDGHSHRVVNGSLTSQT